MSSITISYSSSHAFDLDAADLADSLDVEATDAEIALAIRGAVDAEAESNPAMYTVRGVDGLVAAVRDALADRRLREEEE